MSLWRLFPSLERKLAESEAARIKAEDEVRFWRGRADWAESDRDRARMDLAGALKSISNWQAMMTGAPAVPFPEMAGATGVASPQPQPQEVPRRPQEPRSLRELQLEAVAKSRKAAFERRSVLSALNDATSHD